ncbi:MAG: potassium channel family protein [bacterium]
MKFPWQRSPHIPTQYAVIGIGRFGTSVVETLVELGYEVLAIDPEEKNIARVKDISTYSIVVDVTNEKDLKDAGISNVDVAIICLSDIEANILATLIVKDLGVRYVISRGLNDQHTEILRLIGADLVVTPEKEMGRRIAQRIVTPGIIDLIDAMPEARLIEVSPIPEIVGKKIKDLTLSHKGILVLGIKRNGDIIVVPEPEETIGSEDKIYLFGTADAVSPFYSFVV